MKEPKRYLVTSALPYANGPLHIGHLAGAYLSADIFVRFLRLNGKDVVYVCGSDEHGAAITIRAKKDGTTPQAIVDKYDELIKTTFEKIGISFDRTCPKCSHTEAYGDQCENCGSTLSPTELIDPRSTLSGGKPVLKSTTHWYLPLDKYEAWLREWVETGKLEGELLHYPEDWKNHVLGQCKSWLDGGLQPRAMTRDLDWGVDVPQEIEGCMNTWKSFQVKKMNCAIT